MFGVKHKEYNAWIMSDMIDGPKKTAKLWIDRQLESVYACVSWRLKQ